MNEEVQTKKAFNDKWTNNSKLGHEDIFKEESEITQWILNRNGWGSFADLSSFLKNKSVILDAGCGNGRVTALFSFLAPKSQIIGFDINPGVAESNLADSQNIKIQEHDLMNVNTGSFDFIYSQEVLHHVLDPQLAFQNLVDSLNQGGTIAIYVYKKKSVVREFTDEYIREKLAEMDYYDAIKLMSEITTFGKTLAGVDVEIEIEKVDLIGIPAGKYTIQRLLYHFFFKCFWNDGLSMSENDAINFDWYGPQIATKHTMQEVLEWFEKAGLNVTHKFEDEYGITIHGQKP
jgi:arsenite methyltransferase